MNRFCHGLPRVVIGCFAFVALLCGLSLATHAQPKISMLSGAPAPSLFNIHFYIADQAGLFKEEGIVGEIRYATGAAQAMQITAGGGTDIAMIAPEPVLQGYDKGIRGKYFFQLSDTLIFYLAVPDDSPIRTVTDLKGKKVGVSNLGSNSVIYARAILSNAGIPAAADTFVPVGLGARPLAALRSGQIQALSLWNSAYAAMEASGIKLRYFRHPEEKSYGFGAGFFTTEATLNAKRAELVKFARAIAKAGVMLTANPAAMLRLYWKANPAGKIGDSDEAAMKRGLFEIKAAAETLGVSSEPVAIYGALHPERLQKIGDILKADGLITAIPPVDDLITTDLLREINAFDRDKVAAMARGLK